ncbi:MAG: hypothetical protein SCARUB_02340 [Candidatus Scalindua rubra]|uniref:Uncharacterized protein n=1 Tax=Candidatus Scalindua rubra TaxID=1872076 RepID=A0A1E3XAB1_9BACT|nr:MAG: hypothetical protein SCARUB_02340 [Candidatus Scalindua rubra]
MSRIIRKKNDNRQMFCNIELDSKERILISVAQTGLKIFKMRFGTIPVKTVVDMSLEEMCDHFADPEHYGEPILDFIVDKILPFKSIKEIMETYPINK